jgi:methyl-accepting chemotaxis protein PixJ
MKHSANGSSTHLSTRELATHAELKTELDDSDLNSDFNHLGAAPTALKPSRAASSSAILTHLKSLDHSAKRALLAALISLVPIAIGGGLAYSAAMDLLTQKTTAAKITEASAVAAELSRFLEGGIDEMQALATLISKDPTAVDRLSADLSGSLGDDAAEQLASGPWADELSEFLQRSPQYAHITIRNLSGQALTEVRSVESAENLEHEEANEQNSEILRQKSYFQQTLRTRQPAISEPMADELFDKSPDRLSEPIGDPFADDGDEVTSHQVVFVANAILDAQGNAVGVVVAELTVEAIGSAAFGSAADSAAAADTEQRSAYWLMDSFGEVFQTSSEANASLLGQPLTQHLPTFQAANQQRALKAWQEKGRQIYVYAPIDKGATQLNWSLVSATEPPFAGQRQLQRQIALGTGLAAMAVGSLAAISTQRAQRSPRQPLPSRELASANHTLNQANHTLNQQSDPAEQTAQNNGQANGHAQTAHLQIRSDRSSADLSSADTAPATFDLSDLSNDSSLIAVIDTAFSQALIQGDVQAAAKILAPAISQQLEIDRVSIWQYTRDLAPPSPSATASASDSAIDQTSANSEQRDRQLLAQVDLMLVEAGAAQLTPINLTTASELTVGIWLEGQEVGLIQSESIAPRDWQRSERALVESAAHLMAIAIANQQMQQAVNRLHQQVNSTDIDQLSQRWTQIWLSAFETAEQGTAHATAQTQILQNIASQHLLQTQSLAQVLNLIQSVQQAISEASQPSEPTHAAQAQVALGQGAIASLNQEMHSLQRSADQIVQQMKLLGEFVGLADQFVHEQSEVASLTQTLALNASLVAARASEQRDPQQFAAVSREFDSMANQIRQLAMQTNEGLVSLERRSLQIHTVVASIDKDAQSLGAVVNRFTDGIAQSGKAFETLKTLTAARDQIASGQTANRQAAVEITQSAAELVSQIAQRSPAAAELTQNAQTQAKDMSKLFSQLGQAMSFGRSPKTAQPRFANSSSNGSSNGSNNGSSNGSNNGSNNGAGSSTSKQAAPSSISLNKPSGESRHEP